MIEYENLRKLNEPFFSEYQQKFQSVLESGWFVLGEEVRTFEDAFARYCQSGFCVGTASGLDALTLALKACRFKAGQEVIVPSNTYIATILAIIHCNLKPILVEPDLRTYNLDPSKIKDAITPRTAAIVAVHLYGKCCDMDSLRKLATVHHLTLIEDAAQAHGAKFRNKMAGSFGDLAAFSFYPTKNLGALGDGGCVNTDSPDLARIVRTMRNYGSEKKYYNEEIGVNSRLDELQAAFLRIKLTYLVAINNHKRELAGVYLSMLKDDFIKPVVDPDYHDVYHIFSVRHPKRDQLKEFLFKNGVETEIHYPIPPHHQKAMHGILDKKSFPIAEEIHKTTLSLPISYFHNADDVARVAEAMNRF